MLLNKIFSSTWDDGTIRQYEDGVLVKTILSKQQQALNAIDASKESAELKALLAELARILTQ